MLAFLLAPFYLLFNLYLFRRIMGWVRAWFPWFRKRKHWAVSAALYAFFALSFVLAFPLPAGRLKRALMLIGNYWLGVLLYLLLAVWDTGTGEMVYRCRLTVDGDYDLYGLELQ